MMTRRLLLFIVLAALLMVEGYRLGYAVGEKRVTRGAEPSTPPVGMVLEQGDVMHAFCICGCGLARPAGTQCSECGEGCVPRSAISQETIGWWMDWLELQQTQLMDINQRSGR